MWLALRCTSSAAKLEREDQSRTRAFQCGTSHVGSDVLSALKGQEHGETRFPHIQPLTRPYRSGTLIVRHATPSA